MRARSRWQRFRDYFKGCEGPAGWCAKCEAWVPCQLGYRHDTHYHLHLPDPWLSARGYGHELRWFNARG